MTFELEKQDEYVRLIAAFGPATERLIRPLIEKAVAAALSASGDGWKPIPSGDIDLGDCIVGKWMPGHRFVVHQRSSPCWAWINLSDWYTHYKPLDPPSLPAPPEEKP